MKKERVGLASAILVATVLSACGDSGTPAAKTIGDGIGPVTGGSNGVNAPAVTSFDLAKGCFVMKANGNYAVRSGSSLVANGSGTATSAEHFFMQAAGLSRYVFYTSDKMILTGSGTAVTTTAAPADGSDWTFAGSNPGYTATTISEPLSVDNTGTLVLGGTAALLAFEPASGCSVYPEMPVGIEATPFKSQGVNKPVIGFAEVHSHMGMSSEMSDGSGNVGPSSGGVLYGQPINRFGVTEALKNCIALHGPNGTLSAENVILDTNPTEMHDTVGWPTFVDWPKRDSDLHQQMYYRWIERAYRAGMRTMSIHGTTIEALCNIARATYGDKTAECVDEDVGELQVKYLFDIEKYVDAQEGGPGKGWFRIVKSPAEARSVIADGKLAVIPGLEFSNLFHCRVQFLPGGGETSDCTKADIDSQIDHVWDLGIRQIFPYHDVDSA